MNGGLLFQDSLSKYMHSVSLNVRMIIHYFDYIQIQDSSVFRLIPNNSHLILSIFIISLDFRNSQI
jgi:hypothetical protein